MSKLFRRFSLAGLCFACCSLFCQNTDKAAPLKRDYSQESYVIEKYSDKVTFESDGTFVRDVEGRVRVQSDAGVQHWGLLQFSYPSSNGNLDIEYVRVRKPDGTVILSPPENFQDMPAATTREAPLYSDVHDKHVAVKGLSAGDVLEYSTHIHLTKPLAPGQFWYAYNFSHDAIVLQDTLQIRGPKNTKLRTNSSKLKPAIAEDGNYLVYTWTSSNLETKAEDSKAEKMKNAVDHARGTLPWPDVEVSTFQSWQDVGAWYGGLQQDRVKPTPQIRAKAAELTKGMTDESAKIQAIYNFVSLQFRYIGVDFGIGRYQPHFAEEVLNNQFGDCKDKHTLMASLLEAVGIKVYPALISTERNVNPDVPSPGQFNHVITAVPQGNGYLWLDTTPEVAPFGALLTVLRDKLALVVPPDKPVAMVLTPAEPASRATQEFSMLAKLDDSGTLTGKVERTFSGGDVDTVLRAAFRSVPMPQWKDLVQQISYNAGFAGDVTDVVVSRPEDTASPVHMTYNYKRKDYPDWANRRITAPAPFMMLPDAGDDDSDKATAPIWLGPPQEVHLRTEVELPQGYSPQLPPSVNVSYDFGEFHSVYTANAGKLISDRRLVTKASEVPLGKLEDYKAFRKAVVEDRELYVLLSGAGAPKVSPMESLVASIRMLPDTTDPEAKRYEGIANGHAMQGVMTEAEAAMDKALAADPKFLRGWLMLSGFYLSSARYDMAISTLRKAVEADPKQKVSYKMLGLALMSDKKPAEAVPVWQQVTKLDPEDADAARNLGGALMALKKYPEAATAFEAAVKLDPEVAGAQASLGSAYLHTGTEEKASAAFKKALEIDSSSGMLNNVAYEMAEANRNLTQAHEYAQKAVQQAEEESQKVTLQGLKGEDLTPTVKLGAYWDTLGWVYYRMGNLEEAAKYVSAAWQLSQSAVVGDHLGQVYEHQQNKAMAAHLYAAALAADSSSEEIRARLKRLRGAPTDMEINSARQELSKARKVTLPRLTTGTESAEFFILFGPDGKVEDTKFMNGSDKLRSAGRALSTAQFHVFLPDKGPTRLLRRGTVYCSKLVGCNVFLLVPSNAPSVH